MNDILAKISSYNIFNYLFPGAVFIFTCESLNIFKIENENIVLSVLVYYFAGLTISRIGSIILDPILVWLGWIKFSSYPDFLRAAKKDAKIDLFVEVSNTYRTLGSMCLALIAVYAGRAVVKEFSISNGAVEFFGIIALTCLFMVSYRKQIDFIQQRVEFHKRK